MNWFDKWFLNKVKWAWEYDDCAKPLGAGSMKATAISADHHGLNDGLGIHLKRVIGGKIVTFHRYDRTRDENHSRTYIITDEQDFERELGKIITLESLHQ